VATHTDEPGRIEVSSPERPVAEGEPDATYVGGVQPLLSGSGYYRLKRTVVIATATVALVPLGIMTLLNYFQFEQALQDATLQSTAQMLTNNKRSLEFFLAERHAALEFITRDRTFTELSDAQTLGRVMRTVNESFPLGTFVDLGVIDSDGVQVCYTGPYDLQGRDYKTQDWFHRVIQRGTFTTDVFLGHRHSPHFAIAKRHEREDGGYYILRATFDAEMLGDQLHTAGLGLHDDIFLVNRQRVLQTPSQRYGSVTQAVPFGIPYPSPGVEVFEDEDESGKPILLGCAAITESPFELMYIKPLQFTTREWLPVLRLFGFLAVSVLLILVVIHWGSNLFVKSLRTESMRRAAIMHKVEYTNKLTSIGRLAAGVAHEINNPLAIINENTGLLKDLISRQEGLDRRERLLSLLNSVLKSVDRCKKVTHRLLGFARQMHVEHEDIDVPSLLKEVVEFLGKEAEYRDIRVAIDIQGEIPTIESDRGQLQQVFLNLLNNAVSAVRDGGHVDIEIARRDDAWVSVIVADDGIGIPKQNLQRIFEPFFTTRQGVGTGLGLSITFGIVQKLGGEVSVESEVGRGTRFTVLLPIKRED
jgi:signal transduction histidine kinase